MSEKEGAMETTQYLIVGAGLTADAACKGIRELDPNGPVIVVGEESHPPYLRPPLSKALWIRSAMACWLGSSGVCDSEERNSFAAFSGCRRS